ncbi:MAG: hypothetical protein Q7S42_01740 [Candidatus Omnitrophota bacterium]|nr:hypothetical protein [Candidatus Omnitrophota bacterium]
MKKLILALLLIPLLSGCASVNFSSKYYSLPANYEKDLNDVWNQMITKIPLKYKNSYSYRIVKDNQTKPAGIPQSRQEGNNVVILIPEYFVKYVWEFYYPKYNQEIMSCLFAHELGHPESQYSSKTPKEHLLCDKYTIKNLLLPPATVTTYYSTLIVVRDYWSARKGAGGHLFNAGWNSLNIASTIFVGVGFIGDLYATDLNYRISSLKRAYPSAKFCFKRVDNLK